MRVTVGMIVGQIGAGRSIEELLADYPYLEREDILQALRYAALRLKECEIDRARHEAAHGSSVGSVTASDTPTAPNEAAIGRFLSRLARKSPRSASSP
jgi:hypothetical protein